MVFPIQFVKQTNNDFFAPCVNIAGNSAVVAIGGVCLGAITYLALKALGFGAVSTGIISAIPVTIGVFAGIAGLALSIAFFAYVMKNLKVM